MGVRGNPAHRRSPAARRRFDVDRAGVIDVGHSVERTERCGAASFDRALRRPGRSRCSDRIGRRAGSVTGQAVHPHSRHLWMVITVPQAQPDLQTRISTLADGRMVVTRRVHGPADEVWAVLADGWLYATWVVGASRIRDVDRQWPQVGSRLHHSFGLWPVLIDDHTEVLGCDPGRQLVLEARGWPAGAARVRIMVSAAGTHGSVVRLAADVSDGPGRLIPRPARQMLIAFRNEEALRRLALIAEGRHTLQQRLSSPGTKDNQGSARRRAG